MLKLELRMILFRRTDLWKEGSVGNFQAPGGEDSGKVGKTSG